MHEVTTIMGIKYDPQSRYFMRVATENILYFEHEHNMNMAEIRETFFEFV